MTTLHLGGDAPHSNPSATDIEQAIHTLTTRTGEYLLLVRDEAQNHFTQVAPMKGGLFLLEYRDGYGHMAADEPLEAGDVVMLLVAYATGDDSWIARLSWAPVEI